jgi:hypothetical protein
MARPVITIIRDVLVGRVFGFDDGWERRQNSPGEHGAISKCAHGPQSHQSYHSDHYDEMTPPAWAREIIVIMSAVGFASLGCLDIIIVAKSPSKSRWKRRSAKTRVSLNRLKNQSRYPGLNKCGKCLGHAAV